MNTDKGTNQPEDSIASPQLTKGQQRVGVSFNPSKLLDVDYIKQISAQAIDFMEKAKKALIDATANGGYDSETIGEAIRCFAEAQTLFESAAMWAVKGLTKKL